ncbi:hypothetical protein H8E88_21980 [candidate division KSB1 bacterium]|nr:hypothetical protein [candidate division KSB1 bacterium]MBL7093597.1 hypothetical protein [candidate division KSB1 bacterium]
MKYSTFLSILLILSSHSIHSQDLLNRGYSENVPKLVRPANHDPDFSNFPERSFYQSQKDWQGIIDSTWGPGLPFASKLDIFDQYTSALNDKFFGFPGLGMSWADWDNFRNSYRVKIDSSTSRGRFHALMMNLTRELREGHTIAFDSLIFFQTPLNPGTPVLVTNTRLSVEHFGAVVTVLPDTSVMVLRSVANHPLDLHPGDILLGYENIRYQTLLNDLLTAELPTIGYSAGAASAYTDALFLGAGMSWHLFDTIDIFNTLPVIHCIFL